jgi:hypothetical protein
MMWSCSTRVSSLVYPKPCGFEQQIGAGGWKRIRALHSIDGADGLDIQSGASRDWFQSQKPEWNPQCLIHASVQSMSIGFWPLKTGLKTRRISDTAVSNNSNVLQCMHAENFNDKSIVHRLVIFAAWNLRATFYTYIAPRCEKCAKNAIGDFNGRHCTQTFSQIEIRTFACGFRYEACSNHSPCHVVKGSDARHWERAAARSERLLFPSRRNRLSGPIAVFQPSFHHRKPDGNQARELHFAIFNQEDRVRESTRLKLTTWNASFATVVERAKSAQASKSFR